MGSAERRRIFLFASKVLTFVARRLFSSLKSKTGFLVARAVALHISINTNGRPNPNQSLSLGLSGLPR